MLTEDEVLLQLGMRFQSGLLLYLDIKVKEMKIYRHFLTVPFRLQKLKIYQHINFDVNLLQIKNFKNAKCFGCIIESML